VQRVIKEWFALVDDDGSGTLEHHELLGALQVGLAGAAECICVLCVMFKLQPLIKLD
jgi:hypothetical protein